MASTPPSEFESQPTNQCDPAEYPHGQAEQYSFCHNKQQDQHKVQRANGHDEHADDSD
jgi:hypothetical protein